MKQICPMCKGTNKIKDYHVNNHFKQSLKMTWHETIKCPYCKHFLKGKANEKKPQ
jgi:uncharacterized protein YbaR (Trm112 family)